MRSGRARPSAPCDRNNKPVPLALLQERAYCRSARGATMTDALEPPQGTLDLRIRRTLQLEPQHGWPVAARLRQISGDALRIPQGSLYPALHRLERRGWIRAKWGVSENNRRSRYYELTARGRRQLDAEVTAWERLAAVVAGVLRST